jgi:hypothetical protein
VFNGDKRVDINFTHIVFLIGVIFFVYAMIRRYSEKRDSEKLKLTVFNMLPKTKGIYFEFIITRGGIERKLTSLDIENLTEVEIQKLIDERFDFSKKA